MDLLIPSIIFNNEKKSRYSITVIPCHVNIIQKKMDQFNKNKNFISEKIKIKENITDSPGLGAYESKEYVGKDAKKYLWD